MSPGKKRSFLIVALTVLLTCAVVIRARQVVSLADQTFTYPPMWAQLVASVSRGDIGSGTFNNKLNDLDLSLLQPGDIMLAGNAGGSYGRYTHAGIYIGGDQVVDMYLTTGVHLNGTEFYHQYNWAAILRVKATPQQRRQAVDYARSQLGTPFYILAPKRIDGLWYCSKLVWYAYLREGIDLDPFQSYWVAPDAFFYSPWTELIDYAEVR